MVKLISLPDNWDKGDLWSRDDLWKLMRTVRDGIEVPETAGEQILAISVPEHIANNVKFGGNMEEVSDTLWNAARDAIDAGRVIKKGATL